MERVIIDVAATQIEPRPASKSTRQPWRDRTGAQNVHCYLVFSIRFEQPENDLVLEVAAAPGKTYKKDFVELILSHVKTFVWRAPNGRIGYRMAEGRANGPLHRLILKVLEDDQWIQRYCTNVPGEGLANGGTKSADECPSAE